MDAAPGKKRAAQRFFPQVAGDSPPSARATPQLAGPASHGAGRRMLRSRQDYNELGRW